MIGGVAMVPGWRGMPVGAHLAGPDAWCPRTGGTGGGPVAPSLRPMFRSRRQGPWGYVWSLLCGPALSDSPWSLLENCRRLPDQMFVITSAGAHGAVGAGSLAPVRRLLGYDHQERVLLQVHDDLGRHTLAPARSRELLRRPAASRTSRGKPLQYCALHRAPPCLVGSNDAPPSPLRPLGRLIRSVGRLPTGVRHLLSCNNIATAGFSRQGVAGKPQRATEEGEP